MDFTNLASFFNPGYVVADTMTNCTITGVTATGGNGGPGGAGAAGGAGGSVIGGAIFVEPPVAPYVGSTDLTITRTTISGNLAKGGAGGAGGSGGAGGAGGNAQGGGIYVGSGSLVNLDQSAITGDAVGGGAGGMGTTEGADGTGQGGGVYLDGTGSTMKRSRIVGNSASTGDNNVYGSFS